jgi:hypothetical protein
MAFSNGPKIITDGLVLNLSAFDRNSYVSGSTTWNDVSGRGNNGTLVNGPTFNSSNGGSIVFDGTNDYVGTTYTANTLNNTTQNVWYKWDGVNQIKALTYLGNSSTNGFGFLIHDGGSSGNIGNKVGILYGGAAYNAITPNFATLTASWAYFTIIRTSTTTTLYVNGVLIGSTNTTPNLGATYEFDYGDGIVGASGSVGSISFYNRALSFQEVLQNYNATKSRFGL